jgi:hypothetical protein
MDQRYAGDATVDMAAPEMAHDAKMDWRYAFPA